MINPPPTRIRVPCAPADVGPAPGPPRQNPGQEPYAADQHTNITVIDVPDGQHSLHILDHTDQSRAALAEAIDWVARTTRG